MASNNDQESRLMRLRTLRRVTQAELAKALGVTQWTVTSWEKGRTEPRLTIRQFKTLLKVLDITVDELPDDFGPQPIESGN